MFNRNQPAQQPAQQPPPPAGQAASTTSPAKPAIESLLIGTEAHVATIVTEQRDIVVTTRRLLLLEDSGGWSMIPASSIAAIEFSEGGTHAAMFAKIHFGGGLSRTVGLSTTDDAAVLAGVVAQ